MAAPQKNSVDRAFLPFEGQRVRDKKNRKSKKGIAWIQTMQILHKSSSSAFGFGVVDAALEMHRSGSVFGDIAPASDWLPDAESAVVIGAMHCVGRIPVAFWYRHFVHPASSSPSSSTIASMGTLSSSRSWAVQLIVVRPLRCCGDAAGVVTVVVVAVVEVATVATVCVAITPARARSPEVTST
jgi:hypothetical protein